MRPVQTGKAMQNLERRHRKGECEKALTCLCRQSSKSPPKAAIVRTPVNPRSTFGLLSVQPRVPAAVSLRCVLSKTHWRCVFPTTALTHILILKKRKVHCCNWATTFRLLSDTNVKTKRHTSVAELRWVPPYIFFLFSALIQQ